MAAPTARDHERGVAVSGGALFDGVSLPRHGPLASIIRVRWLAPVAAVALIAAALWILHQELSAQHLSAALKTARNMPGRTVALALVFTASGYLVLSLYDILALRYLGKSVSRGRTQLASFVAYAFSNNLGLPALTGGAVRYRLYRKQGIDLADVALITAFNALTLGSGFALSVGISILASPGNLAAVLGLHDAIVRGAGIVVVAGVASYAVLAGKSDRVLRVGRWSLRAPGPLLATLQPAIGMLDLTMAGAVLWSLLPAGAGVDFVTFAAVYAVASMAGILSHVPGGLGVFESVILLLLPQIPRDGLAASLIAYRAIYYLLPLGIAGLAFAASEVNAHFAK